MSSVGLVLFHQLCEVGNALEWLRETYTPLTDEWLWHTEVLGLLDEAIDTLVESSGLSCDE